MQEKGSYNLVTIKKNSHTNCLIGGKSYTTLGSVMLYIFLPCYREMKGGQVQLAMSRRAWQNGNG